MNETNLTGLEYFEVFRALVEYDIKQQEWINKSPPSFYSRDVYQVKLNKIKKIVAKMDAHMKKHPSQAYNCGCCGPKY